jgi:hypothetical protein
MKSRPTYKNFEAPPTLNNIFTKSKILQTHRAMAAVNVFFCRLRPEKWRSARVTLGRDTIRSIAYCVMYDGAEDSITAPGTKEKQPALRSQLLAGLLFPVASTETQTQCSFTTYRHSTMSLTFIFTSVSAS